MYHAHHVFVEDKTLGKTFQFVHARKFCVAELATSVDKSRVICVLELKFEKNLLYPLKTRCSPHPSQHSVENQVKLQVLVFNNRELKHRRFWATDVNRKSNFLLFDTYFSLFVEMSICEC